MFGLLRLVTPWRFLKASGGCCCATTRFLIFWALGDGLATACGEYWLKGALCKCWKFLIEPSGSDTWKPGGARRLEGDAGTTLGDCGGCFVLRPAVFLLTGIFKKRFGLLINPELWWQDVLCEFQLSANSTSCWVTTIPQGIWYTCSIIKKK